MDKLKVKGNYNSAIVRLKDIAEKKTLKNINETVRETFTNSAENGIISQSNFFDRTITNDKNISGYYIVGPDDFVYNPRISTFAPVGPINRNKLGRQGVVSPLYLVFSVHDVVPEYLEWYFKSNIWHKFMRENGNTGARADRFSISDAEFFSMPILLPPINIQKRIARTLTELDSKITSEKTEVEKLKALKSAILDKMFPKGAETVPEIRFKGFTGQWKQRNFSEVFEEYSEKNHPELPPLTIIQGYGTVLREKSNRNIQYDKKSLSGYKKVLKNDFILHLRSFEGGLEKANTDGIISPAYHTFHGENIDSRFYYAFFRSVKFIDILLKPFVYGIRDGKSIDIEGMKSILIPFPLYEEQDTIGECIERISNLINLHQRKYIKLLDVKKAMLEKLIGGEN